MAMKKVKLIKVVLALMGLVAFAGLSSSAHAQFAVPPGSYQQTCQDIFIARAFQLNAQCNDGGIIPGLNGSAVDLRFCAGGGDISNDHGLLNCVPLAANVPGGSYRQNCELISADSLAFP
jgi:hypothetical protein